MSRIDEAKLRAMSLHDRHTIWSRARGRQSAEAEAMVALIEGLGLPYSEPGGAKADSALVRAIQEIVFSPEGKAAGLEAAEKGLPALAGVDPLLATALGVDYGPDNQTTNEAGFLVAQMMRPQGFKNSGRKGSLPAHCVAKTAETFVPAK